MNTELTPKILRTWLNLNMDHLGLKCTDSLEDDIEVIQELTKIRFQAAVITLSKMFKPDVDNVEDVEPFVLYNIQNVLNEKDEKMDITDCGFIGKLYSPQQTLIAKMLQIEQGQSYKILTDQKINILVQSNVGIISERFSFGKTFLLPALFCVQPIPSFTFELGGYAMGSDFHSTETDDVIPTNVVLCGNKTVVEWCNNLEKHTNLSYQKIMTAKDLGILSSLKDLPQVVIIKDGIITWNKKGSTALEHFLTILRDRVVARFIVDDYDMLKLKSGTIVPNSCFNWFISTTNGKDINLKDIGIQNSVGKMMKSKMILDFFYNLRCNSDYSSIEFNIPCIDYYLWSKPTLDIIYQIIGNKFTQDELDELRIDEEKSDKFLKSTGNVPYQHNRLPIKILLSVEDKLYKKELVAQLNSEGINSVGLDRRNIHKFGTDNNIVGVSSLIHGVNMGYLTHIIVICDNYNNDEINQIVGRAQRISRTQNLQVFLCDTDF